MKTGGFLLKLWDVDLLEQHAVKF